MPSERILLPLLGVALRPVLAQHDEIFLRRLYREVREPELALTPWSEAQRQAFSDSQFTLQDRHYRAHYPGTQFWVVERAGEPIGRLYVDESQEGPVCLMEISLLLTHRGQGLGEGLDAGTVLGGRQQNVGAPRRRSEQQTHQQQAAPPEARKIKDGHP